MVLPNRHYGILVVLLALLLTACNSSNPASSASTSTLPKAARVDAAKAATISGTVNFDGAPPHAQPIDMGNDSGCKGQNQSEQVVTDNGHLANVLVYIKAGLPAAAYDPPKQSVILKQEGCRYVPHVAAVMTGQPVRFLDEDPTIHNIHPMPKNSPEWNQSQMPNSGPLEKTFAQPELLISIRCNLHPWMHMYLNVMGNPYFAVTGADGKFTIPNLPPGTYTIAALHEKYGEKTQTLTIEPKGNKILNFSYQP